MNQDNFADRMLPPGAVHWQPPWSRRSRPVGGFLQSTLLVGHPYGVAALHQQLLRRPGRDYRVIGCCLLVPGQVGSTLDGLPVLGGPQDVVDVVCRYDVDTVAVLTSPGFGAAALRRLESDLEPTGAGLMLAPAATRPLGTRRRRLELRGVNGLGRAAFDRTLAALLLVLLAPVLLGVAACLRATGRGPVLDRRERVGRDGRVFCLLTFSTAADAGRTSAWAARVRSAVRRFSLDELPQLVNVLKGDLSLVGPRPGPPSDPPDPHVGWPVRPGLIGLRTPGEGPGRPPADGDLRDVVDYAENWSLLLDLTILGRALVTALRGHAPP